MATSGTRHCTAPSISLPLSLISASPHSASASICPFLSVSVSLALLCSFPTLPFSLFLSPSLSFSPSLFPSPSPFFSYISPSPQAFSQEGEGHPPLHSCRSISNPKGLRRGSQAARATPRGAQLGSLPPEPPTGLGLLSLLLGGLRASFHGGTVWPPFLGRLSIARGGGAAPTPKCLCSVFIP